MKPCQNNLTVVTIAQYHFPHTMYEPLYVKGGEEKTVAIFFFRYHKDTLQIHSSKKDQVHFNLQLFHWIRGVEGGIMNIQGDLLQFFCFSTSCVRKSDASSP